MLYRVTKRVFDLFSSLIGLVILTPFFIVISLAIVLTSRGGIFFRQQRVGRNGKPFRIMKFRTMVKRAESRGMQITTKDDARVTKVGKILRKTKIDELPQLFNVLFGQMSLVGPRPEVPKYVELYTEEQRRVLSVKPGITDLASIEYRNENDMLDSSENPEETYINEIMPIKLNLNLSYIDNRSFFYDIGLIFKTIWRIIR